MRRYESMGLAKKGSRMIVVGEMRYRWRVSPDDGFIRIVVEKEEQQGQRLSVQIGYDDEPSPTGISVQKQTITPALIRQIILKATSLGWAPSRRGKALFLKLVGVDLLPIRYS
jgi:hypothetical protein